MPTNPTPATRSEDDMAQQFTFTAYLYRGRNEREVEVDVTYEVRPGRPARPYGDYPHPAEPDEIEIVSAKHDESDDLTEEEYDFLHDLACDRADEDLAEWRSERDEYLADMARDRRELDAYENRVPPMGAAA